MPATTRGGYVSNCAELRSQALFERSHGCEGLSVRRRHVSYGSGTPGSANARKAAAQNFVRSHSPARGFLRRIVVRERIQADAAAVFVTIVQFFLPPLLQTFSHVFGRAPGRRLRRRSRLVFFFLLRDHKAHRTRDQRLHGFSHFHRLHVAAPTARERSSVTATSFLRRFPGASFVSFSRRAAPVTSPNPSRTYLPCASLVRLRWFRVCFEGASSTMPFFLARAALVCVTSCSPREPVRTRDERGVRPGQASDGKGNGTGSDPTRCREGDVRGAQRKSGDHVGRLTGYEGEGTPILAFGDGTFLCVRRRFVPPSLHTVHPGRFPRSMPTEPERFLPIEVGSIRGSTPINRGRTSWGRVQMRLWCSSRGIESTTRGRVISEDSVGRSRKISNQLLRGGRKKEGYHTSTTCRTPRPPNTHTSEERSSSTNLI